MQTYQTALAAWVSTGFRILAANQRNCGGAHVCARCAVCGHNHATANQFRHYMSQQVSFPFLPIISTFSQHPIGSGLEGVLMQFASTIKFMGDTSKRFVPIAVTSEKSAIQPAPVQFDFQKEWTEADFPQSKFSCCRCCWRPLDGKHTIENGGDCRWRFSG